MDTSRKLNFQLSTEYKMKRNERKKYFILCIPDDSYQMNMYKNHHVVRRTHLKCVIHLDLLVLTQSLVQQPFENVFEKTIELNSLFSLLSLLVHNVKLTNYHLPQKACHFEVLVKVLHDLL